MVLEYSVIFTPTSRIEPVLRVGGLKASFSPFVYLVISGVIHGC
jgi:hypothetical protein